MLQHFWHTFGVSLQFFAVLAGLWRHHALPRSSCRMLLDLNRASACNTAAQPRLQERVASPRQQQRRLQPCSAVQREPSYVVDAAAKRESYRAAGSSMSMGSPSNWSSAPRYWSGSTGHRGWTGEDEARGLTALIRNCTKLGKLIYLLDRNEAIFNHIHASAALVKAAELIPSAAFGLNLHCVRRLTSITARLLPHFDAQGLVNVVWALAKLDHYDDRFMQLWARQAGKALPRLDARATSVMLWALAKFGHANSQFLARTFKHARQLEGSSFNAQDNSNMLWALARLQHLAGDPQLVQQLLRQLQPQLPSLSKAQLANAAWAVAALRYYDPTFMDQLIQCAGERLKAYNRLNLLNQRELYMLLWSLATLGHEAPAFVRGALSRLLSIYGERADQMRADFAQLELAAALSESAVQLELAATQLGSAVQPEPAAAQQGQAATQPESAAAQQGPAVQQPDPASRLEPAGRTDSSTGLGPTSHLQPAGSSGSATGLDPVARLEPADCSDAAVGADPDPAAPSDHTTPLDSATSSDPASPLDPAVPLNPAPSLDPAPSLHSAGPLAPAPTLDPAPSLDPAAPPLDSAAPLAPAAAPDLHYMYSMLWALSMLQHDAQRAAPTIIRAAYYDCRRQLQRGALDRRFAYQLRMLHRYLVTIEGSGSLSKFLLHHSRYRELRQLGQAAFLAKAKRARGRPPPPFVASVLQAVQQLPGCGDAQALQLTDDEKLYADIGLTLPDGTKV